MLPEVRAALIVATIKKMKEWGLNWRTIQKVDIKKTYRCPVAWRTLHKLVKDRDYKTRTSVIKDLLGYYDIAYTENYNIVQLFKIEPNA